MRWFYLILALFIFQGPLFAAENPPIFIYPIKEDSYLRLIYTANLLGSLQNMYTGEIQQKGALFRWNFDWAQSYVGAGSNYLSDTKEFSIMLFGGEVRVDSSNFEVLAATLCHEFGHFLGGTPKQMFIPGVEHWSSAEGQSDWFAASQCLPKVYDQFKISNLQFLTFHDEISTAALCVESKDKRKCQWILGAVESLAKHFDELYEHYQVQPSLLKKASEVVSETLHTKYPSVQCRLDTMKEAAFCADRACERPACWFKKDWNFGLGCIVNCKGF